MPFLQPWENLPNLADSNGSEFRVIFLYRMYFQYKFSTIVVNFSHFLPTSRQKSVKFARNPQATVRYLQSEPQEDAGLQEWRCCSEAAYKVALL